MDDNKCSPQTSEIIGNKEGVSDEHNSGTSESDSSSDDNSSDSYSSISSQNSDPSKHGQSPVPICKEPEQCKEDFVDVSFKGRSLEEKADILPIDSLSPGSKIPTSQSNTSSELATLDDEQSQGAVKNENEGKVADTDEKLFYESDSGNDDLLKTKEGSSSQLDEGKASVKDERTEKHSIPDPPMSKFLNPFLMGPRIPFQPRSIPQNPVLMFPHIPQPIIVLPHPMAATQARWPYLPLPSVPQKKVTEADFVRFSALKTSDYVDKSHSALLEETMHKDQNKQRKKKSRLGKAETVIADEEEPVRVKYKTEYRKTNRASTMLICDKVKLPVVRPGKTPSLVDVSAGPQLADTSSKGSISENVTKRRRTSQGLSATLELGEIPTKFKIKINKGKDTVKGKKVVRARTVTLDKILKSDNGTDSSKARKIPGKKQKKMTAKAIKSQAIKIEKMKKREENLACKPKKPKLKKILPPLTPEKLLYNRLTEVVKQIAEPNIFSPMTLPPSVVIRCSDCEAVYPDRKSLWDHVQSHLKKPVPFRLSKYYRFCKLCRKYVSEIRDHIRACHFDGGTPYECEACPAKFRYKGLLRNHIQNRHTTARNYMCEVCGLAFKQSVTLRKHMLVHSDVKTFFCTNCGKAFKTMYALQKHSVVHALVKPYKCEICNKGFTQQTNMKSHQRTHTGEKPYQCELCTLAFTHNVSLKTHKKKYHGIDMWSQAPGQTIILPPDTDQPDHPNIQLSNKVDDDEIMDETQDELDVWFPTSEPSRQSVNPSSNSQSNTQSVIQYPNLDSKPKPSNVNVVGKVYEDDSDNQGPMVNERFDGRETQTVLFSSFTPQHR